jgi:hypothetical protein
MRQRLARKVGVAQQVDRDDVAPGLAFCLGERLVRADAGVVDEDVDAPERRDGLGDNLRRRGLLCEVNHDRE